MLCAMWMARSCFMVFAAAVLDGVCIELIMACIIRRLHARF